MHQHFQKISSDYRLFLLKKKKKITKTEHSLNGKNKNMILTYNKNKNLEKYV